MDKNASPFSDEVLVMLAPLVSEALRAFGIDASYGVAIVTAGRKVVARRQQVAALPTKAAALSPLHSMTAVA